jgi:hypothetical protein
VAALVLGPPAPLALLLVGGRRIVQDAELRTTDAAAAMSAVRAARKQLFGEGPALTRVPVRPEHITGTAREPEA